MASNVDLQHYEYPKTVDADSNGLVAMTTGLGGRREDLEYAAKGFAERGNDVVIYTYSPDVLLAGDLNLLPDLGRRIADDIAERAADYDSIRSVGVSLGTTAVNYTSTLLNEKFSDPQLDSPKIERTYLGATGGDAVDIVLHQRWFRSLLLAGYRQDIRKAYRGVSDAEVADAWSDVLAPPTTPVTVAIGGLDRIMRPAQARKTIRSWRQLNSDIKLLYRRFKDHSGTIRQLNHTVVGLTLGETKPTAQKPPKPVRSLVVDLANRTQKNLERHSKKPLMSA